MPNPFPVLWDHPGLIDSFLSEANKSAAWITVAMYDEHGKERTLGRHPHALPEAMRAWVDAVAAGGLARTGDARFRLRRWDTARTPGMSIIACAVLAAGGLDPHGTERTILPLPPPESHPYCWRCAVSLATIRNRNSEILEHRAKVDNAQKNLVQMQTDHACKLADAEDRLTQRDAYIRTLRQALRDGGLPVPRDPNAPRTP